MGISERKQRERSEMREAILSAALQLFSDEGYDNVTMRKIASKIEYSIGTLYLYFKNKDEIFLELHKIGFDEFYNRQLSIQNIDDPKKRLSEHGLAYIQFAIDKPLYYDLMFISRIPTRAFKSKEDWNCGIRTYDILKLNIKQAAEAGYFNDVDIEVAAFSLWSFVHGIASLYVRDRLFMMPMDAIKVLIEGALHFLKRAY